MQELLEKGAKQVRYKDAIYIGQIQNAKRGGEGVMKYANGRQYEGEWMADLRHG